MNMCREMNEEEYDYNYIFYLLEKDKTGNSAFSDSIKIEGESLSQIKEKVDRVRKRKGWEESDFIICEIHQITYSDLCECVIKGEDI